MLRWWRPPGRENAGRNALDRPAELAASRRIYVLPDGRHRREREREREIPQPFELPSRARRLDGSFLLAAAH